MNMQDQLDIRKWLKNKRIGGLINPQGLENDQGGLINLPSYHYVDINQVTPIISNNWITSILFGIGIWGITKIVELYNIQEYSNIWDYIIATFVFFAAALGFHFIFITKKFQKLRKEAVHVPPGAMEDFINSIIHTGGDTGRYRDSTST